MVESIDKLKKTIKKELGNEFCNIWYRPISVYLTKLFLYTPISANQVTLLSILSGVLGGLLMILSNNLFDVIGIILLQFYWILDHVDGEVARYRKSGSLAGEYFDFMAHYIVFPVFLIGMTFGAYKDIEKIWVFAFGFSAAVSIGLQKDITAVVYWIICNEKKNRIKKGITGKKYEENLSDNEDLFSKNPPDFNLKDKVKGGFENALHNFPKLKVTLSMFANLLAGGICSELGIILMVFLPAIADIVWDGTVILGRTYRFMTLFLMFLGGLYPILLVIRIVKNIVRFVPDKEYKNLFD